MRASIWRSRSAVRDFSVTISLSSPFDVTESSCRRCPCVRAMSSALSRSAASFLRSTSLRSALSLSVSPSPKSGSHAVKYCSTWAFSFELMFSGASFSADSSRAEYSACVAAGIIPERRISRSEIRLCRSSADRNSLTNSIIAGLDAVAVGRPAEAATRASSLAGSASKFL